MDMNAQTKKRSLGQYFTKQNTWLRPQITQFIKSSGAKIAYDPFAGNGDLLGIAQSFALKKCLTNDYGVVIIPETFINSSFPKNRLVSITILEDNPFDDTETPVCV